MVEFALDRLFEGLNRSALRASIEGELGSLAALDGFVRRAGRPDGFACAVGRVVIVASDTTIGVALPPAVFALCAKCDVALRDRNDGLAAAFATTLAEECSEARLRVLEPTAHEDAAWLKELEAADAVVVFGSDSALRDIRLHTPPQARFVAFGHRTSVAYIERDALRAEQDLQALCDGIARDSLLYDGEGCLSAHAVFCERDASVSVERFAALLADALERATVEFPSGRLTVAGGVLAYRDAARFRAALDQTPFAWSAAGGHLLVTDPPRDAPPPLLPRTLAVYGVDEPGEFVAFVHRHNLPLEAVALTALPGRDDVVAAVLATGAARIGRAGELQAPSFAGEHGGVGRITPFVRWVTRDA